jgi:hypothetical protein
MITYIAAIIKTSAGSTSGSKSWTWDWSWSYSSGHAHAWSASRHASRNWDL